MAYTTKTPEQCEQIAQDLASGLIWTSDHTNGHEAFNAVILFGGQELIDQLTTDKITTVYEYLDKAGPLSINGMPSFLSFQMLDSRDSTEVYKRYKEIIEFKKSRLEGKLNGHSN